MPDDTKVLVSWYNCDCPWTTKYCDEYHRSKALLPLKVVKQFELDPVTGRPKS